MKSAIIGLPGSGKKTVFEALTRQSVTASQKGESCISTLAVPDPRVDRLSGMYSPRKTIYAQVEYVLPGLRGLQPETGKDQPVWNLARDCDALIHVVRNFSSYGVDAPTPAKDVVFLDQELILADLVVVEKRLERLKSDKKKGNAVDPRELSLLAECRERLENETVLRKFPQLADAPQLKGYAFLSAKPVLVLFNNDDATADMPEPGDDLSKESCLVIRGKLEQELAQMTPEEAAEFLAEFAIDQSARDRVIAKSYELLGLISFFTVGKDEVRAWTVKKDTPALDAAGVIHSDMQKGFIRAEVLAYDDLTTAGSYATARKQGTVRLEGKNYIVKDGDIINFRFNV